MTAANQHKAVTQFYYALDQEVAQELTDKPVSYTHLTLPTTRSGVFRGGGGRSEKGGGGGG
ncbi:hypothetical protein ACRTDI_23335, partial [Vibrio fluvialis]